MTFLVNQTKSYTLVVSTETGEMRLELAEELKENLKEQLAGAETSTEAANALFEVLGNDAFALVEAIDALYGMGGELAAGFGSGGVEAMEALLGDLAAQSPGADLMDRVAEKGALDGFGFVEMPGDDVADMLGWAMPSGENPFAYDPNDAQQEVGYWGYVAVGIGLTLVVGGILKVSNDASEKVTHGTQNLGGSGSGSGSDQMPADPDEGYINPLDNPFGPEWSKDEALDPTYGQILTDPNAEGGVSGEKDYDPEAELAKEILTDPEAEQRELTAEEVIAAAEADIVNTTLPVDPDVEFEFDFGDQPDLGGGEDFSGAMDGDQVFDAELQVEFVAEGMVQVEGTSTAVVDHKSDDFHSPVDTFDFA